MSMAILTGNTGDTAVSLETKSLTYADGLRRGAEIARERAKMCEPFKTNARKHFAQMALTIAAAIEAEIAKERT